MENKVFKVGFEMVYNHSSGGVVWQHELVDVSMIDYNDILEIAMDKAQVGCEVHILPTLPEGHPLRKVVFENAKERKCPDLKINGVYTEVKIPIDDLHWRKINNNIKSAQLQADEVIIKLHSNFSVQRLAEITKGRFLSHQNLRVVEFKMEGRYYCFKRDALIKNEGSL